MKVSDIMTKNPVTVSPASTLGNVVELMAKHKIRGVPVVSRSRLVGVVTQTDVIRAIDIYKKVNKSNASFDMVLGLIGSQDKKIQSSINKMMKAKIRDLKGKKVISVEADEDLYRSAALINMHDIDRLPVTKNGRLVGIITKTDLILALEKWKA